MTVATLCLLCPVKGYHSDKCRHSTIENTLGDKNTTAVVFLTKCAISLIEAKSWIYAV